MLTEQEAAAIYAEPKKMVRLSKWTSRGGNLERTIWVQRANGELLVVRVWCRDKYGFALIYRGCAIVRWDFCRRHTNPDGSVILNQGHKHRWRQQERDHAYAVEDIPTTDVNEALVAFLRECNIRVERYIDQIWPWKG